MLLEFAEIHFGAGAKEKGMVFLLTVGTGIGTVIFYRQTPCSEFGVGTSGV